MYHEIKLTTNRVFPDGKQKQVREQYLAEGCTVLSEAELKAFELCNNECDIISISQSKIKEIVKKKESDDEAYYRATAIDIFLTDEGAEKEIKYYLLTSAKDISDAKQQFEKHLEQGFDFRLEEIKKTNIIEII